VRTRHAFTIEAIVVLPDHLHTIWTLPQNDADFSTRWRLIKTAFSRSIETVESRSASRRAKGERGIWQRRYWEHTLRDENDFERHCNYIHFNPVKHGHVSAVRDWPYSSFQRFGNLGGTRWIGLRADLVTKRDSEKDYGYRHRTPQPILRFLERRVCSMVERNDTHQTHLVLSLLARAHDVFDKLEDRLHIGVPGIGNIEILLSRNEPA